MTAQSTDKFTWLTDRFITLLENGVNPWRKDWNGGAGDALNFVTGKPYNGKNPLILTIDSLCRGASDPYYCGRSQGFALGWNIRKGSKAAFITYANVVVKENETESKKIPFVKWSAVFNIEDWSDDRSDNKIVDILPKFEPVNIDQRLEEIDKFISGKTSIHTMGGQPCYRPFSDLIVMPCFEKFTTATAYYATALHELTHWSGHKDRCNRDLSGKFGSVSYAKEELIAEMGSALLCQKLGIPSDLENHASYLQSWLVRAKESNKFLYQSMTEAIKAYEFLTK